MVLLQSSISLCCNSRVYYNPAIDDILCAECLEVCSTHPVPEEIPREYFQQRLDELVIIRKEVMDV